MAEPALPRWLSPLARLVPARYRDDVVHDLLEERDRLLGRGRGRAWTSGWLFGHLVRSAVATRVQAVQSRLTAGAVHGTQWPAAGWGRELRQAARALRQAPWYTATMLAVTALGVALAATVFAIVDGVLFRPLPYPAPDEIHVVTGRFDELPPSYRGVELVSPNEAAAWAGAVPDVALTALLYTSVQLPDGSHALGAAVDRSFFEVFGVKLLMGGFADEHYVAAQEITPVIISHRLWRDRFSADAAVIGQVLRGPSPYSRPFQIVGVLTPEGFVPPLGRSSAAAARRENRIDVLRPPTFEASGERSSLAFARVPSDRSAEILGRLNGAVAALAGTAPALRPGLTEGQRRARAPFDGVALVPLAQYLSARERPVLALVFASVMSLVCLVLLNAGALSAARAHQRIRDLALRRALGARTRDLLRHALAEQALLVIMAGSAGVLASPLLLSFALERLPPGLNLIKEARLDGRVMVFALLVSATAAIAVALLSVRVAIRRAGALPQLTAAHGDVPGRVRVGRVIVAAQTAIAFALVLGGSLFTTSLARVWEEDPGIQLRNVMVMDVLYPERDLRLYRQRALDLAVRLRGTPAVAGAAVWDASVLQNAEHGSVFQVPSAADTAGVQPMSVNVSSGFFETAGVQLVTGRLPSDTELDAGAPVIVVSETVARTYWPGRSALGQSLRAGRVDCTVIGVVGDVRLVALDVPSTGVIFSPWSLRIPQSRGPTLLVKLDDDDATTRAAVLDRIRQFDADARLTDIYTLEEAASTSIRERRLSAFAATIFAGVALIFVVIGVLGLAAMTASRRTREVGIRLALGASRQSVMRLLVIEQLGAVTLGLAAGTIASAWAVRLIGTHLYGVGVYDVSVWLVAGFVTMSTAASGAWLPARRASRIDPTEALRVT